jgi:hypothetical protein
MSDAPWIFGDADIPSELGCNEQLAVDLVEQKLRTFHDDDAKSKGERGSAPVCSASRGFDDLSDAGDSEANASQCMSPAMSDVDPSEVLDDAVGMGFVAAPPAPMRLGPTDAALRNVNPKRSLKSFLKGVKMDRHQKFNARRAVEREMRASQDQIQRRDLAITGMGSAITTTLLFCCKGPTGGSHEGSPRAPLGKPPREDTA